MKLIHGLLDYSKPWQLPNIYLFTGNPIRRKDGGLVMGRGAAKQLRDSYPGLDRVINTDGVLDWTMINPDQWIGWFKVKHHWRDAADLALIQEATSQLTRIATQRPEYRFHINYPGVGNGRVSVDQVEPILVQLPDNIYVYIRR